MLAPLTNWPKANVGTAEGYSSQGTALWRHSTEPGAAYDRKKERKQGKKLAEVQGYLNYVIDHLTCQHVQVMNMRWVEVADLQTQIAQ